VRYSFSPIQSASWIVALAAILFLIPSISAADTRQSVETIVELAAELKKNGTDLCIVRMPVRPEIYAEKTDAFDAPLEEPHVNTVSARRAQRLLEDEGIPVINLYPYIRRESLLSDIFMKDRFHFTPEAEAAIARILDTKLQERGLMMQPGRPKDVVFMGECFADSFARELISADPLDKIKVLNKNGGGNLVHNYLFVFKEEYLKGTDLVVWVFTDRHFSNSNFASLEPEPDTSTNVEARSVVAELKATTLLALGDESQFDYPDALRTSVYQVETTGERLIGIDQIMKDRQITLGRKIGIGDRVRLKLVPWGAWIREHQELVKIFMIDDVEDFTLPRYWIADWLVEPAVTVAELQDEDGGAGR